MLMKAVRLLRDDDAHRDEEVEEEYKYYLKSMILKLVRRNEITFL